MITKQGAIALKLNKKVKRIGIISTVLLIGIIGIGKMLNIPVLSTGINYILYPLEKGIDFATREVSELLNHFKDVDELLAENEKLKEEVSNLTI